MPSYPAVGGWMTNVSTGVAFLNICSPVDGTVWGDYRTCMKGRLLDQVSHWDRFWGFIPFPHFLSFFVLSVYGWRCDQPSFCSCCLIFLATMDVILWTSRPNKSSLSNYSQAEYSITAADWWLIKQNHSWGSWKACHLSWLIGEIRKNYSPSPSPIKHVFMAKNPTIKLPYTLLFSAVNFISHTSIYFWHCYLNPWALCVFMDSAISKLATEF